jgi:hypothetical protein
LDSLACAADAVDAFLAEHAPEWLGHWAAFGQKARALMQHPVTKQDLRALRYDLDAPYRGTMGSMTDLAFAGDAEAQFRSIEHSLFAAWNAVEEAAEAGAPREGKVRYALVALEEEFAGSAEALEIRAILNAPELDYNAVVRLAEALDKRARSGHLEALKAELNRS